MTNGDIYEPNDTSDVASNIGRLTTAAPSSLSALTINLKPDGSYDQDWFKWNMGQSGTVTIGMNNISAGGGDLILRVFKLNSNNTLSEIGNSVTTGGVTTRQVSAAVNAGDEIYAWIQGYNFATGGYDLSASIA